MLRFAIGLLAGLVAGVFMWLPMSIAIGGIMIGILRLPGDLSANADLLVMTGLYAIWLLAVWAIVRHGFVGRLTFFHGLLCSLPLPTILINYDLQLSLQH
jgi:hypothetical protein